jgi:putative transposase
MIGPRGQTCGPKGLLSHSEGLHERSEGYPGKGLHELCEGYPGTPAARGANPNGVASLRPVMSHATMPQSLSNMVVHLVFSTRDRHNWFPDKTDRNEWFAYIGGVSKKLECPTIIMGGMGDHVHILARLGRTTSLASWVGELKRVTSAWVKERFPDKTGFYWQEGYGAFSVSQSAVDAVIQYIETQEEHHAQRDFKDEFRLMLSKHGITWDEKYVWD